MASSFLLLVQKETEPKKTRPRSQALIKQHEGSLVGRNLCGCAGTHEL
jgi:hypothetical protein